jgi:hypothetical protein
VCLHVLRQLWAQLRGSVRSALLVPSLPLHVARPQVNTCQALADAYALLGRSLEGDSLMAMSKRRGDSLLDTTQVRLLLRRPLTISRLLGC